ncbi:Hint domain-containing protein [Celeribacter sp.]|uniref:Hint domain-containing protein n=1 Tax=Celeribacter sp. TaxID=1890673 RepID=UPI003A8DB16F
MPILQNGDFSNGLSGWDVQGAGATAPTYDETNGWVVFGSGNNDVTNGDTLSQEVHLTQGQEYTLTFTMTEMGAAYGGFGLNIDLLELNPDGSTGNSTSLGFEIVWNGQTNTALVTFTSPYDDAILQFRGGFGFGGVNSALILDDIMLACFAAGTLIETPTGLVPVETLGEGDLVMTLDDGPRPLRWVGQRQIEAQELQARPQWKPVVVPRGAFGQGRPMQDLWLSPNHRLLISNPRVELMFGSTEVLVAAKHLVGLIDGVYVAEDCTDVIYCHILFDRHHIVSSNGISSESFHPAMRTVNAMERAARDEILALFPELVLSDGAPFETSMPLARPVLRRFEAAALAA